MATLNQNGIIFTLNGEAVTPFGGKYTNNTNYDGSTGLYNINQTKLNNVGVDKSVNAVEIDWNNAQVGNNVTINTTGELLSWIKNNPGPQGPQGEPGTWDSSSMLGYQSIDLSGARIPNGDLNNGEDKQFDSGATMEDLLNYIGDLQHEIYVLSAAVISLANRNT